jgi:hypothetical protein
MEERRNCIVVDSTYTDQKSDSWKCLEIFKREAGGSRGCGPCNQYIRKNKKAAWNHAAFYCVMLAYFDAAGAADAGAGSAAGAGAAGAAGVLAAGAEEDDGVP